MGTTSTETVTRTELVQLALRQIGVWNPSPTEIANAVVVLNATLKMLDPRAQWSWTSVSTPASITLTVGQRSYDVATDGIAANIFELLHVDRVDGTSLIPITIIDTDEALTTSEREGTGQPYLVWLERQPTLAAQKLHFFPTASVAYTFEYTYRRRLYDFTASTDNPDFPGEWNYPLSVILADKMAPEYGVPLDKRQILRIDAEELTRQMTSANDKTVFIPTVKTVYY